MEIKTTAFSPGGPIPKKFTGEGEDLSPALSWTGVPEKTQSLALIMDDPDAPPGTWVHWLLYDLPATSKGLPEGLPKKENLDGGAKQVLCWGVDSFDRVGYFGPLPPPGKPHRYYFKLFALDVALGDRGKLRKAELEKAMQDHVLSIAELQGTYEKKKARR